MNIINWVNRILAEIKRQRELDRKLELLIDSTLIDRMYEAEFGNTIRKINNE